MPAELKAEKGAVDANVYATAEEADSFLDDIYGADEWANMSDEDKDRLLITATRTIERLPVRFNKVSVAQRLNFPIASPSVDSDGFAEAKEACIWQAFYVMQNNDAIQEGITGAIQGVKSESLGPTSKSVSGFNPYRRYAGRCLGVLAPFIDLGVKIHRG